MKDWKALGLKVPDFFLPKKGIDLEKWAVVACDQYTSQKEYWQEVEGYVQDAPSTLHLMLPEIYLETEDVGERIQRVWDSMETYQKEGLLDAYENCSVLLEREVDGKMRKGLMMLVDLECYDYSPDSQSLIRATEGTIVERIPPRLKIREKAGMELPHILILVDDFEHVLIKPLFEKKGELLYDTPLMQGGGHLKGYKIDMRELEGFAEKLDKMRETMGENPLLFAVGDGNHSLATAKAHWEKIKQELSESEQEKHPARYALIELENLHDQGIIFEAIHRVLFNAPDLAFEEIIEEMQKQNPSAKIEIFEGMRMPQSGIQWIGYRDGAVKKTIEIRGAEHQLAVGTLQKAIDAYMAKHKEISIDFIHGDDVTEQLAKEKGNIGFLLQPMEKSDLFKSVQKDGPLPRKTFSMGEANEKRYYMECRKIR